LRVTGQPANERLYLAERKGKAMKSTTRFLVAAILIVVAGVLVSAAQAAEKKQPAVKGQVAKQATSSQQKVAPGSDRWRYTFHNGEWWYWLPEARWVFWRDNRWNHYDPKTYVAPILQYADFAAGIQGGWTGGNRVLNDSDVYPFYGRTTGQLDRRTLQPNEEVGPFYGHALPNEVFGPWRWGQSSRPAYGHALSSGGD
jgi:hypothetical protein